ncbi:hypothetical protein ACJX0J_012345 [Zea mays]
MGSLEKCFIAKENKRYGTFNTAYSIRIKNGNSCQQLPIVEAGMQTQETRGFTHAQILQQINIPCGIPSQFLMSNTKSCLNPYKDNNYLTIMTNGYTLGDSPILSAESL